MFGKNQIEGQKFFRDAAADSVMVTSVFLTLQGEGPFMGRPALFVRLAKCNLACSFCDTYFDHGDWMTVDELLQRSIKIIRARYGGVFPPLVGVVITGGEPMLQKGITALCDLFIHNFAWVQIETNGTVYQKLHPQVTLVVSPKVHEGHIGYARPHKEVLARANCLKFVVSADPASPYHGIPGWAQHSGKTIYISPMNVYKRLPAMVKALEEKREPSFEERNKSEVISFWDNGLLDMDANRRNHEYAAQYALDNRYNLSLQMHLYAGVA